MRLPLNNTGAVWGGVLVAVALSVLQGFAEFLATGSPFPATGEGWVRLLAPSIIAGVLGAMVPRYSMHERETGHRHTSDPPDAPVVTTPRQ